MDDCLSRDDALELLRSQRGHRESREAKILAEGFPAYTTQVGWLGYSAAKIKELSKRFLAEGFTAFKLKVGSNLEDDKRRLRYNSRK